MCDLISLLSSPFDVIACMRANTVVVILGLISLSGVDVSKLLPVLPHPVLLG